MQFEVEVNGRSTTVTVNRRESRFSVSVADRKWLVDAAAVGSHTLSLLVERVAATPADTGIVESREVSLAQDPVTGQLVAGLGAVSIVVGLNSRRRWGRKDEAKAPGWDSSFTASSATSCRCAARGRTMSGRTGT